MIFTLIINFHYISWIRRRFNDEKFVYAKPWEKRKRKLLFYNFLSTFRTETQREKKNLFKMHLRDEIKVNVNSFCHVISLKMRWIFFFISFLAWKMWESLPEYNLICLFRVLVGAHSNRKQNGYERESPITFEILLNISFRICDMENRLTGTMCVWQLNYLHKCILMLMQNILLGLNREMDIKKLN